MAILHKCGWVLACLLCLATVPATAQTAPVMSNLRLWLDAADVNAGGAQPANGAPITVWRDKSGNGYNATASGSPSFESAGLNSRPSVRLAPGAKFSAPNIFTGSQSPQTTMFVVQANINPTTNFFTNLNGDTDATSGTTARFSTHSPWKPASATSPTFYFDAGACCGATRLQHAYTVPLTQALMTATGNSTTAYSGVTFLNLSAVNQFIRQDGETTAADSTAIAPYVTGGFRLGSTAGYNYDGRASEVLVYDRALTLDEIKLVECYLGKKWAIIGFNKSACPQPVAFDVAKTSSGYTGNPYGAFKLPGNDVIYKISVSYVSGSEMDANSLLVIDALPADMVFANEDYDGASGPGTTPVGFTNAGSSVTFNYAANVKYSNGTSAPASMSDCSYAPVAGYDPDVRYICVNPSGQLLSGGFDLYFRAHIP